MLFTHWYLRHIYGPPFDAHIAVSEYAADELRAALSDRPPGFVRVCPNTGGVLEYASLANAGLAEPRGAAFAEAIRAAAGRDPDRVSAARETVERFRWRVATCRYFATYDDLHRRFSVAGVTGSCSRRAPAT